MSMTVDTATDIRTFSIDIADEQIDDLRRRIAATRWPSKELVQDRSQGVQLATIQELARYWAEDYDFGRIEARLNALPQFITEIDGIEIHFIHLRSKHEDAMPLIMTHGWPGSVIELHETIGPLTDPTAHGGTPGDAFHLVLPSIPGYGFSGEPTELGWDADRIARAWAELMRRLGYTRYVAQGGDVGAYVTDAMGRQAPEGLLGIHLNVLTAAVALKDQLPAQSEQERAAHDALTTFLTDGFAIVLEQSTRPQTIGYSLLDSPVGLAAWMLDHDTDSYYKISRAFVDGEHAGNLTRDLLDRRPGCVPTRALAKEHVTSIPRDTPTSIRPIHIDRRDAQIDDLRRRIAATRWQSRELVEDRSKGKQLATMKELARYWT